jgi:hypothetical protein
LDIADDDSDVIEILDHAVPMPRMPVSDDTTLMTTLCRAAVCGQRAGE